MLEHHPTKSPSSFPAKKQCPCYKPGEPGEEALRGTIQHEYLQHLITGKIPVPDDITDEEKAQTEWAYNEIKDYAKKRFYGGEIVSEQRVTVFDDDFKEITFGTLDAAFEDILFDYKSGQIRNYWQQMACYALARMQKHGLDRIFVVELYGKLRDRKEYWITKAEAEAEVYSISASVDNPEKRPAKNSYCSWCGERPTCSEWVGPVMEVVNCTDDFKTLANKPMNELTPVDLDRLLPIADIAEKWGKAVKEVAKKRMASGEVLPGHYLKEKAGARFISDLMEAKKILKLNYQDFLEKASISLTSLEKLIMEKKGLKKKEAQAFISSELASVIETKAPSFSIAERAAEIEDLG